MATPEEAALSIREETGKPIKFVNRREAGSPRGLHRHGAASWGYDVITLVEKAQAQFDEKQAQKLQKKIRRTASTSRISQQVQQIKKMGNVKDLLAMVPGMGKALRGVDLDDDAFKHIEAIIQSVTPDERQHPDKLNGGRPASPSSGTIQEVNQLIKQFGEMKKMMKMMSGGGKRRGLGGMMGRGAMPGGMDAPMNPMEMNTPQILDGEDLSERIKAEIAEDVARHVAADTTSPTSPPFSWARMAPAAPTWTTRCAVVPGSDSRAPSSNALRTSLRTNCWRLSMGSTMTLALTDSSSNSPSPTTSTPKPSLKRSTPPRMSTVSTRSTWATSPSVFPVSCPLPQPAS